MTNRILKIYTDGACTGNPGPGGWGAVLIWNEKIKKISGSDLHTTNNRMELLAVIKALESVKLNVKIEIFSDSSYVINGMTKWLPNWQKKGWKRSGGELKNITLWKKLADLNNNFDIKWTWVRGHDGNKYNEIADKLATNAIQKKPNSR